jgi:predicted N-acetyltransferase YhbS
LATIVKEIQISLLSPNDIISDFDCGDPDRNDWFTKRAVRSTQSDDARTYVARTREGEVIGFFALAVGSVMQAALPGKFRRNAPDPVSCVLLAQLGVSLAWQKQGVGRELILEAMEQILRIAEIAGCRLFLVHHASPKLADWYKRFGFLEVNLVPVPVMVMALKDVRATLAAITRPPPGTA